MKLILSLHIQQNDKECVSTLHHDKKVTTFKTKGIGEAFEKARELYQMKDEGKECI